MAASFAGKETFASDLLRQDLGNDWDESQYRSRAAVKLECSCGEHGLMAFEGILSHSELSDDWEEVYRPVYCSPPPQLVDLDKSYPQEVRQVLEKAFSLAWTDCEATSTQLRIALERILDDLQIERFRKDRNGVVQLGSKGRPKALPLSNRITLFKEKGAAERELAKFIDSVKWLGNSAAHGTYTVHEESVFHAFHIIDAVLKSLYRGLAVQQEIEYYSRKINLFYHPSEQTEFRKVES